MEEKIYSIDGMQFRLKSFEDYTHNEEEKIKSILGLSDKDNTIKLNTSDNNEVFPLLLIPVDITVNIYKCDFNTMKNGQVYDIITDWITSRIFFTQNMGSYFSSLLQKKIQQTVTMKENTKQEEPTLP